MLFPSENGKPAWFALTVKPKHEKTVGANLNAKGLEPFVPLYRLRRRWSDRVKNLEFCLFPGYVFCRVAYEQRLTVLNLPGVTSMVGFGKQPAPIPEAEIEMVRAVVRGDRPVYPWPYLHAGQKVRIEQGALAGLQGSLLREKDAWRVIVNVELLRRSIAVEIDRDMISPVQ